MYVWFCTNVWRTEMYIREMKAAPFVDEYAEFVCKDKTFELFIIIRCNADWTFSTDMEVHGMHKI